MNVCLVYLWNSELRFIANGRNIDYRNFPKFSDRQVWTNSVDPDQTAPRLLLERNSLIRVYTVCHSIWTFYSIVEPPCSKFRVITANFSGVRNFRICTVVIKSGETILSCILIKHMGRLMTKPTKWHVRPAKTQISLGIRPVWSESSLSARRTLGSLATHWAHSKDSDQTG